MPNTQFNPQKTLNEAMQHMQNGQFSDALPLFKLLEQNGLKDHRLYRAMGSAYERLQQADKALDCFKKSLAIHSKQADLQFAVGNICFSNGNNAQAKVAFQQAVNLSPTNLDYKQKLAYCLLANKELTNALEAFQFISKKDPQNVAALIGISRVYVAMGKLPLAHTLLQESMQRLPNQLAFIRELGWLFKDSGKADDAITWFEKLLALEPNNTDACEDLALACLDKGDFKRAIDIVVDGLKANPMDQKLNKLLATLKFEFDYEDHLDHYRSISVEPSKTLPDNLLFDYIQNLITAGNVTRAQEEINKLKRPIHTSQLTLMLQLSLWNKQNNAASIIESLQFVITKGTSLEPLQIEMLCKAYLALGEGSKAIRTIKPLLERFPNDQYYWALYTTALRQIDSNLYHMFCNYDELVFNQPLQLDVNQPNIEEFSHNLKNTLEGLHVAKRNPLDQSLIGGTQTVGQLFNRQEPIIVEFKKALRLTFEKAFKELTFKADHPVLRKANSDFQFSSSWSVRLKDQGFHVSHVHPKGWYSSAFYVDLPSEIDDHSKQGWLHMGKPGISLTNELAVEKWVKPKTGHLVLFPSYFWHGTEPFKSDKHRLSVGLDIVPT